MENDDVEENIIKCEMKVRAYITSKATVKRKITIILNKLKSSKGAETLTITLFLSSKDKMRLLIK